jgi:hypothetical protein
MRIVEVNKLSFSDYTQQNNINIRQFSREYFSTTRNIESDILDGTAISS